MSELVFTSKSFDIFRDRIELKMLMNKDIIFVDSISSVKKVFGGINLVSGSKKYVLPIATNTQDAIDIILALKAGKEVPSIKIDEKINIDKDKKWYKSGFGLFIAVVLFFLVPYLMIPYLIYDYTSTKCDINLFTSKNGKPSGLKKYKKEILGSIAGLIVLVTLATISSNIKYTNILNQANRLVSEKKFEDAKTLLNENVKEHSTNSVLKGLLNDLEKLEDDKIREIIVTLSDENYDSLVKNKMPISPYSDNLIINESITAKVIEQLPNRQKFIAEDKIEQENRVKEITAQLMESNRNAIIADFSGWDGAYFPLDRLLKKNVIDYEHQSTTYTDQGDHFIILTSFRGQNAFGGTVINSVKAKVDIYTMQLEILETYY